MTSRPMPLSATWTRTSHPSRYVRRFSAATIIGRARTAPCAPGPPSRETWHAEPARVADNLYFLGTKIHNAWAIVGSGGIIILEALYDYAAADEALRGFMQNHAGDAMIPQAHYWLGESQFQRQQYNDAAETFLDVYNKYPHSPKAAEALMRLGQSLAALGKQDAACASLGAVLQKYPKASAQIKTTVQAEQKRVRC